MFGIIKIGENMKQELSKYDILNNKMISLTKLFIPFMGKITIALTKNQKQNILNDFVNKLLSDAHVVFEIRKDAIEYLNGEGLEKVNAREIDLTYVYRLLKNAQKFDKILLFNSILKDRMDEILAKMLELSKDQLAQQVYWSEIYYSLLEIDRVAFDTLDDEHYTFEKLPQQHQDLIIKIHDEFMQKNIIPLVNRTETKETEFLKGMELFDEKMDARLNIDLVKPVPMYDRYNYYNIPKTK